MHGAEILARRQLGAHKISFFSIAKEATKIRRREVGVARGGADAFKIASQRLHVVVYF